MEEGNDGVGRCLRAHSRTSFLPTRTKSRTALVQVGVARASAVIPSVRLPTVARYQVACFSAPTEGSGNTIEIRRPTLNRDGETAEALRSRLLYQSRKRGIKELDLIMGTFAHEFLHTFTIAELREYDVILNEHDNEWDMYLWLVGKSPIPEYLMESQVMRRLVSFAKNEGKEVRIELPPLRESQV